MRYVIDSRVTGFYFFFCVCDSPLLFSIIPATASPSFLMDDVLHRPMANRQRGEADRLYVHVCVSTCVCVCVKALIERLDVGDNQYCRPSPLFSLFRLLSFPSFILFLYFNYSFIAAPFVKGTNCLDVRPV